MRPIMLRYFIITLLLSFSLLSAVADTFTGIVGNFSYQFDSESNEATLIRCTASSSTVTIPASVTYNSVKYTVTAIGVKDLSGANSDIRPLANLATLTEVKLPSTLKVLGHHCFSNCSSLQKVVIPEGVEIIGDRCFNNTGSLTELVIPENVTYLGRGALAWTPKLAKLSLLCDAYIAPDFISIDGYENQITSLTLGGKMKAVNDWQFSTMPALQSLVIEGDIETIGESAFEACIYLKSLTISGSVNRIKTAAFKACPQISSLNISAPIYKIEGNAFAGCSAIPAIQFPSTLREIGASAFEYCTGLKSITLPNGLSLLGAKAFYHCEGLEDNFTIPYTVTTLGASVLEGCSSITSLDINCVSGSVGTSLAKDCTSLQRVKIAGGITKMFTTAFKNCTALTDVTITAPITEFRNDVFTGCSALTNLTLPGTLTSIQASALQGTAIKHLTLPASLKTLGANFLPSPMESLTALAPTPLSLTADIMTDYTGCVLNVPAGSEQAYEDANIWKNFFTTTPLPQATSVAVTEQFSINVGRTRALGTEVTFSPAGSYSPITWVSDNSNIATVDQLGNVKAIAKGSTTIKLMQGEKCRAISLVTVLDKLPSPLSYSVIAGSNASPALMSSNKAMTVYSAADFMATLSQQNTSKDLAYPIGKQTHKALINLAPDAEITLSAVPPYSAPRTFGPSESTPFNQSIQLFTLAGNKPFVWTGNAQQAIVTFTTYTYAAEDIENGKCDPYEIYDLTITPQSDATRHIFLQGGDENWEYTPAKELLSPSDDYIYTLKIQENLPNQWRLKDQWDTPFGILSWEYCQNSASPLTQTSKEPITPTIDSSLDFNFTLEKEATITLNLSTPSSPAISYSSPIAEMESFTVYLKAAPTSLKYIWIWNQESQQNPWGYTWPPKETMQGPFYDKNHEPYYRYSFEVKKGSFTPTNILFIDGSKQSVDMEFFNNHLYIIDKNYNTAEKKYIYEISEDEWEPGQPGPAVVDNPVTLYLYNDANWQQAGYDIYCYVYGSGGQNAQWPGVKMQYNSCLKLDGKLGFYTCQIPDNLSNGYAMFHLANTKGTVYTPAGSPLRFPLDQCEGLYINNRNHIYYTASNSRSETGWQPASPISVFSNKMPILSLSADPASTSSTIKLNINTPTTGYTITNIPLRAAIYNCDCQNPGDKQAYSIQSISPFAPTEQHNPHTNWLLLPLHADSELNYLRNITGHELSRLIGLDWTAQIIPVELVVAGDYRGIYFLTEEILPDPDRVNIFNPYNLTPDNITDMPRSYLLKLHQTDTQNTPTHFTQNQQFTDQQNLPLHFHAQQADFLTQQTQLASQYSQNLQDDLQLLVTTLNNMAREIPTLWFDIIDSETAAKYLIVNELMDDPTAYSQSLYIHSASHDNQARPLPGNHWKFGPVWDFSHAFASKGNKQQFLAENNPDTPIEQAFLNNKYAYYLTAIQYLDFTQPTQPDNAPLRAPSSQLQPGTKLAQVQQPIYDAAQIIDAAMDSEQLRWPQLYTTNHETAQSSAEKIITYLAANKTYLDTRLNQGTLTQIDNLPAASNLIKYYDLQGRPLQHIPSTPGIYIITTPGATPQKIIRQ